MKKLSILALSAMLLVGCQSSPSTEADTSPLKIGVITPLSGNAAMYGEETQKILSETLQKINAEGGYNNQDVELIYEDGKCSGTDAVTAYQKLMDIDQVDFIMPWCSNESLAVAPLATEYQMLSVTGTSSTPNLEGQSPFLYSFSYSDKDISNELINQLKGYEKIAVISEQNEYNLGIQQAIESQLADQVVISETFEKTTTDFRNTIEKVLKTQPDAIMLNPFPGPTATALGKQLNENLEALTDIQLVSQIAYLTDDSRIEFPEVTEGMILVDAPAVQSPAGQEFIAQVKANQGEIPKLEGYLTLSLHDALYNLVAAANAVGKDSVKARDYLVSNKAKGLAVEGQKFEGKNFIQGFEAGVFKIQDAKAVAQD